MVNHELLGELVLGAVIGAGLTPMQLDVFLDQTLLNRTCEDLKADYGCSRAAVGQASRRARTKLARRMGMELAA